LKFIYLLAVLLTSYLLLLRYADCPNRKPRRTASPKIKVTAFRGYAPRLTVESSTKKREHHDSDEEPTCTFNRLSSTNAPEWIGTSKLESTEVGSLKDASSSSKLVEVDAVEEAGVDILEANLTGDVLNKKSIEKLDIVLAEEERIEVDLSIHSLELDATKEAKAKKDIFAMDLAEHPSSNATMGNVDAVYEPNVDEDEFEVDLLGIAMNEARNTQLR
jgi:starch synthase